MPNLIDSLVLTVMPKAKQKLYMKNLNITQKDNFDSSIIFVNPTAAIYSPDASVGITTKL